mgnify:CR=1 FL=1|tara:strand:+ start:5157 stop:6026 length:870 start_codon:yes stop_codon:yes gene_type:complete
MGEIMSEEVPAAEPSQPDPVSTEPVPEQPSMHKVKVDGQELEVSLNDLVKNYSLEQASRKKFDEASQLRKEVDEFVEVLQKGDLSPLKEIVSEEAMLKFAEGLVRDKVEFDRLDDSTKAKMLAEKERDLYKNKLEEQEEYRKQAVLEQMEAKAAESIDEQIVDAISQLDSKYDKLVATPEFIQDCARHMVMQLDKYGANKVDSSKAAQWALNTWKNRMTSYAKQLSPDDLSSYLSKNQIESLRKANLDSLNSGFPRYGEGSKVTPKKGKQEKVSVDEWMGAIEKRLGNG